MKDKTCHCVSCKFEFTPNRLITIPEYKIDGLLIAFDANKKQIRCTQCNGAVVRKKGKIEEHQLNKWAAQNKDYAKRN